MLTQQYTAECITITLSLISNQHSQKLWADLFTLVTSCCWSQRAANKVVHLALVVRSYHQYCTHSFTFVGGTLLFDAHFFHFRSKTGWIQLAENDFFCLAAEVLSELRAADLITLVHSLGCPSLSSQPSAHASCNAALWRPAWQRLTVSCEWCFHWAAAGGRALIGGFLEIINDVVRNNPNTLDRLAALPRQPPHTALHCPVGPVLGSARAQHRSQTNPPASLHSTKWRPRARPDQAAPLAHHCSA